MNRSRPAVLALLTAFALLLFAAAPAAHAAGAPPSGARVTGARLTGIAKGRPKLTLTVSARAGARLRDVVVDLPPALLTGTPANALRFTLRKPRPSARLTVAYPALRASPKLLQHFASGVTKRLGLVVATRETGGKGARLPLVLPLH